MIQNPPVPPEPAPVIPEPKAVEAPKAQYSFGNYKEVDGSINNVKDDLMTDDELGAFLDKGGEHQFTFAGEDFTVRKESDAYKAFDSNGQVVDDHVRINSSLTVDSFVEIGGLPGLGFNDRLYLGCPGGNMTMYVGEADLDAKSGGQLSSNEVTDGLNAELIYQLLREYEE